MYIKEQIWYKLRHGPPEHEIRDIPHGLAKIRTNSKIHTLTHERAYAQEWITRTYTPEEISRTLKH